MKRFFIIILFIICLTGLSISVYNIARPLFNYEKARDLYDDLRSFAKTDSAYSKAESEDLMTEEGGVLNGSEGHLGRSADTLSESKDRMSVSEDPLSESKNSGAVAKHVHSMKLPQNLPEVDFEALEEENSDFFGWLWCEDTLIDYPVVKGSDNEYYLHHLFDGSNNPSGCLFVDAQSDFDPEDVPSTYVDNASEYSLNNSIINNSIIYGHHMKDDSMFGTLNNFGDQDWYEDHPCFFLILPERILRMDVFSAYVASDDMNSWQIDFQGLDEYKSWIEDLEGRSEIDTILPTELYGSYLASEVSPAVMTLSTCSYEFENAFFVVHLSVSCAWDKL